MIKKSPKTEKVPTCKRSPSTAPTMIVKARQAAAIQNRIPSARCVPDAVPSSLFLGPRLFSSRPTGILCHPRADRASSGEMTPGDPNPSAGVTLLNEVPVLYLILSAFVVAAALILLNLPIRLSAHQPHKSPRRAYPLPPSGASLLQSAAGHTGGTPCPRLSGRPGRVGTPPCSCQTRLRPRVALLVAELDGMDPFSVQ